MSETNVAKAFVFKSKFDGSTRIVFATNIEDPRARLPFPRLHQWVLVADALTGRPLPEHPVDAGDAG